MAENPFNGFTMKISVDCYSGYCAEEKPKRFKLRNKEIEVVNLLSHWLTPGYKNFLVQGNDNSMYTLQLDTHSWNWELTAFQYRPLKALS